MNTRLDDPTTTADPMVRGFLIVSAVITNVGVLAPIRAAVGGGVDQVTVRVDNQAGSDDRVGLGEADPGTLTTFEEPDIGSRWTLVASYGGQEVHRETLSRTALAASATCRWS
jgi:hypothetical protein